MRVRSRLKNGGGLKVATFSLCGQADTRMLLENVNVRIHIFAVTELNGRTFAMWTALSSILCLYCAKNPQNRAVYSASACKPLLLRLPCTSDRLQSQALPIPHLFVFGCRRNAAIIRSGIGILPGRVVILQDAQLAERAATTHCGRCFGSTPVFLVNWCGNTACNHDRVQVSFSRPRMCLHVGISVAWLGLGFNYYTAYSSE